jgi:hypothetical protein
VLPVPKSCTLGDTAGCSPARHAKVILSVPLSWCRDVTLARRDGVDVELRLLQANSAVKKSFQRACYAEGELDAMKVDDWLAESLGSCLS